MKTTEKVVLILYFTFIFFALSSCISLSNERLIIPGKPGSFTKWKKPDANIRKVVSAVKNKLHKKLCSIHIVKYKVQVVAGLKYQVIFASGGHRYLGIILRLLPMNKTKPKLVSFKQLK